MLSSRSALYHTVTAARAGIRIRPTVNQFFKVATTAIRQTRAQIPCSHRCSRHFSSTAPIVEINAQERPDIGKCGPDSNQSAPAPQVATFFETSTSTWQYIVSCPETHEAVIIDSVLNYNPLSGVISTESADGLIQYIRDHKLHVQRILETHIHADHLTAATYIQHKLSGDQVIPIGIGSGIDQVQRYFAKRYSMDSFLLKGNFDTLYDDNDTFLVGRLEFKVMHLPGHTPDHIGYLCGESLFCGDTIFMPDVGSARADFPGGSPSALYNSVNRVLALPLQFKIYVGHDYPPSSRCSTEDCPEAYTTVERQRVTNKHLKSGTTGEEFTKWRKERDGALNNPRLMHASLQVNLRAGKLPVADDSGNVFVKVPLMVPGPLSAYFR